MGLSAHSRGESVSLADLVDGRAWGPDVGPVSYAELPVGVGRTLTCISTAVALLTDGDTRIALLLSVTNEHGMRSPRLRLEAMSPDREAAVSVLGELRRLAIERSVYRGQVVSFVVNGEYGPFGGTVSVTFHERDQIARDALVLADGVLESIERHTIALSDRADQLRARGYDVKRGLLLFGPPGTGKTLTVRYLAGRQPDRTVVVVPGANVSALDSACILARQLAPATVVLEDVDLVAEERTMWGHGQNPMLAALLTEIDRVPADADVVFILTTNRPDLLEPALAARPGRVDQAIEISLPNEDCRARLLALYAHDVAMTDDERDRIVARLDGVASAFVKELGRRAAMRAAFESGDGDERLPTVADLDAALDELFRDSSALTRSLLGAEPFTDHEDMLDVPPGLVIPTEVREALSS
jgi:hypothetical protein